MERIKLDSKYKLLETANSRYFVVTGGRGSGKSFSINMFLARLLLAEKGHKVLFTRYTLTSAGKSIIPEFVEKIDLLNANQLFKINNNEIVCTLTGSSIIFSGIKTSSGNQTANLKSLQGITTWVLDEAEELDDEDVFDKIDESVRIKDIQNRVILVLNPALRSHWIYKRFFQRDNVDEFFTGTKSDTSYIYSTYLDNAENLSDSFINKANLLKDIDYQKYKHRFLGSWLDTLKGRMYDHLKEVDDIPEGEPVLYCDTADTGKDFLCSIVAIRTESSLYIKNVVYTREPNEVTERLVAQQIIQQQVNRATIESNNGGRAFARAVDRIVKDMGHNRTRIKTFHQSKNKDARINSHSSDVVLNCYFCKDLNKEFMLALRTYSREDKNEFDDGPDSVTGLVEHYLPKNREFIFV